MRKWKQRQRTRKGDYGKIQEDNCKKKEINCSQLKDKNCTSSRVSRGHFPRSIGWAGEVMRIKGKVVGEGKWRHMYKSSIQSHTHHRVKKLTIRHGNLGLWHDDRCMYTALST